MRRLAGALVLATTVALATASAATLGGIAPGGLGAGADVVAACDADGFSASYTTSGGVVTAVILGGIADPGCVGGKLSAVLTGAGGASLAAAGPVTVPGGGTMTLALGAAPTATAVTGIHVVVTGT